MKGLSKNNVKPLEG